MMAKLDPDIEKVLRLAGLDPITCTDKDVILADHLLIKYPNPTQAAKMLAHLKRNQ